MTKRRREAKLRRFLGLIVAIVLAGVILEPQQANAAPPVPTATARLVYDFDSLFLPGVAHGFLLGPASDNRSYVIEVSPLDSPSANGGFFTSVIQPEFDSVTWNDVARIQLLISSTAVNANVRIYALGPK